MLRVLISTCFSCGLNMPNKEDIYCIRCGESVYNNHLYEDDEYKIKRLCGEADELLEKASAILKEVSRLRKERRNELR